MRTSLSPSYLVIATASFAFIALGSPIAGCGGATHGGSDALQGVDGGGDVAFDGSPADTDDPAEVEVPPDIGIVDAENGVPDATPDSTPADGETPDVDMPDAETPADTQTDADTPLVPPLAAPLETWTWIPLDGTYCGNGSTNGLAVNLTERSSDVLIVLQGGGICWDFNTCFVVKSASHVEDTLTSVMVLGEVPAGASVFDRNDPTNPFRDASFVFAPYCTGDFFAGDSITEYAKDGVTRTVHHVGSRNWATVLPRLQATFPAPSRVWLTGYSAGGLGALWNWWRLLDAFPVAEVHALNDCGTPIDPVAGRFDAWNAAVKFVGPPGCADCTTGHPQLVAHYVAHVPAQHRYAQLAYRQDLIIQAFTGLGWQAVQNRTAALKPVLDGNASQRLFMVDGTDHVMMGRIKNVRTSALSGGVLAWDWVRAWALGSAGWDHAGP